MHPVPSYESWRKPLRVQYTLTRDGVPDSPSFQSAVVVATPAQAREMTSPMLADHLRRLSLCATRAVALVLGLPALPVLDPGGLCRAQSYPILSFPPSYSPGGAEIWVRQCPVSAGVASTFTFLELLEKEILAKIAAGIQIHNGPVW